MDRDISVRWGVFFFREGPLQMMDGPPYIIFDIMIIIIGRPRAPQGGDVGQRPHPLAIATPLPPDISLTDGLAKAGHPPGIGQSPRC